MNRSYTNAADPQTVALIAIGWIVADARRGDRLLDATGLTPDQLRDRIDDAAALAAVLDFLMAHEPDLLACAEESGLSPEAFVDARAALAR